MPVKLEKTASVSGPLGILGREIQQIRDCAKHVLKETGNPIVALSICLHGDARRAVLNSCKLNK